ncbi:YfhD family protein [Paenibacillus cremeus]|uniref:YfhD family protein n=1 Tax=Paenibacillus cremeus TaxID=2163881 RepID=A0A559KAG0_9BACL|nr:YfhD family protein [Paenibacillus cremeus]TVY09117.1 YfhD family protein [Paenibacillus cremeus]
MDPNINQAAQAGNQLPIGKNEDVEFSSDMADEADMKALQRAQKADQRQQEQE